MVVEGWDKIIIINCINYYMFLAIISVITIHRLMHFCYRIFNGIIIGLASLSSYY